MLKNIFIKALKQLLLYFLILCIILVIIINYLEYPLSLPYVNQTQRNMKHILIWAAYDKLPLKILGAGQHWFLVKHCSITNCYIHNRNSQVNFCDITNYDVVLFHAIELNHLSRTSNLPKYRSPHQKYVFACMESAANYPVCSRTYDRYFNLTMTYKLNSDVYFGYILIRNKEGQVVGPKQAMQWMDVETMEPINDKLKERLNTKRIAAAWFVSNCKAQSKRHIIAERIEAELAKYNMTLDIYGSCGKKHCPVSDMGKCLNKLERDYYFYLSFENSLSEDYVTEKLLHALQHYTVPIVYGGANYTRFMPDGIYLDAKKLTASDLAKQMADIIYDKDKYYSYFKWHNHYSYHYLDDMPDTEAYCKLCELINNEEYFNRITVIENITDWWRPHNKCWKRRRL